MLTHQLRRAARDDLLWQRLRVGPATGVTSVGVAAVLVRVASAVSVPAPVGELLAGLDLPQIKRQIPLE